MKGDHQIKDRDDAPQQDPEDKELPEHAGEPVFVCADVGDLPVGIDSAPQRSHDLTDLDDRQDIGVDSQALAPQRPRQIGGDDQHDQNVQELIPACHQIIFRQFIHIVSIRCGTNES